ncbi:MAG: apolipoprotein N-acyltransferase [candidate division WOR-3 bacterium]
MPVRVANWRRIVLLFFAGAGLSLAFAPFPFRFLAFFALVPLFWVLERSRRSFFWGWLFGFFAAMFHLWWLWFLVVPVEPVTRFLLNIGVVLLFGYLGLYWGVVAVGVRWFGLWSAPFVVVLLEFLKTRGQIGFPWDFLGYTMTPWPVFIQIVSVGGVYLLSLWVVLVNLLIYGLLFRPRRWQYLAGLVAVFLVVAGFGLVRMRPCRHWFNVAVVQPNVSPFDKGDLNSRQRIQEDLFRLSRQAAEGKPALLIFPETATLVDITHSTEMGPMLQRLVDSLDLEIFTGTPVYDDSHRSWHNGAVLVQPRQPITQRYYKLRLVPFSEKIPYSDELPVIRKLIGTADMGNWDRGWEYTVFQSRVGLLSGLICYEAIFPDLAREFVHRGARLLVVVTNDGWFGRLPGAYQHAELAVMRTAENGVPMVRSANNGISFIVDPYGRVLKQTRLFEQTVISGSVPQPLGPTVYRILGDRVVLFYLLTLIAGIFVRRRFSADLRLRRRAGYRFR